MEDKKTFVIESSIYSFYENKSYSIFNYITASNESEANKIAKETILEIESQHNHEIFPSLIWFDHCPYFEDESLIKAASEYYEREVFLQKRGEDWFLYDDLLNEPLEKLTVNQFALQ
ncbi:hypothetical protein [Pseudalkalibacillus caeni]|uniref:Uncharacterized protein n=1 Tax=Exobacillus caeni TaxID=2574798 RepID=A0A5R9EZX2_9BACL|nr:hypothetical protein [Pseudalkalibacillus caeni]TLS36892.1 hypothetical protein FCL54_13125 [Pseudalkalibacillus caeni]